MHLDEGVTVSSWSRSLHRHDDLPDFPMLRGSLVADVCVIGAGIAGLTSAYLLAKAGKSVVVLDDSGPASGQSGRTSAHLASYIDDSFTDLERALGPDAAALAQASHAHAIDFIETTARHDRIACDFARLDAFLFPADGDSDTSLDSELDAARRAGITADKVPAPFPSLTDAPCLRIARQARFHPLKYLTGLTRRCLELGVRFSTGSRVTDCTGSSPGSPVRTLTADGSEIRSAAAVVATNVPAPIGDWTGIYLKQAPYRTYMLAFDIDPATLPDALYWDTADPYHYVRLDTSLPASALLLVGGEDHKVGQPPPGGEHTAFQALEVWTRKHFPSARDRTDAWSGQVQEPDDFLAFLGRAPTKGDNVYVITGDSGMGLTHGTLGALICSDLILGRTNPYAELYSPTRKPKALASLTEFASEQLNVAAQYTDLLTPGDVSDVDEIPRDTGAIVRHGTTKLAVYRAPDGTLSRCSAVCTHMGCIVRWNDVEKSGDCPCHGSRFDPTGRVLTGPATTPLKDAD